MKRSRGFTLIECLVAMAVVVLLVSLLLPALSRAREAARQATCLAHLHGFGQALTAFAHDHADHLPGVYTWGSDRGGKDGLSDEQRDWLSGPYGPDRNLLDPQRAVWEHAPEAGTLYPYMEAKQAYRCPSVRQAPLGSGQGSNGKYDRTMIGRMGGARLDQLPNPPRVSSDASGQPVYVEAVPFFVEEDPRYNLNRRCYAGSFANSDRLGTQHTGNSCFAATDGSARRWPDEWRAVAASTLLARRRFFDCRVGIDPDRWNWWGEAP